MLRPSALKRGTAAGACLAAFALGLSACSDDDDGDAASASTGTNALTVYSSLPIRGGHGPGTEMSNGIKLALAESGGKVGPFTVKYVSLDDGSGPDGARDPDQVVDNARAAVQDRSTIAYIGEYHTGASALSIPLLNQAGILQVSPHDTRIGLTQADGATKGEPDKYYPTGERSFGRVVPADDVQIAAQVAYQETAACMNLYVLDDGSVDGEALAAGVERSAEGEEPPDLAGTASVGDDPDDARKAAERVTAAEADCVFYGAGSDEAAAETARLTWRALSAADPDVKLFGPDTIATADFARALGRAGRNAFFTAPQLGEENYPLVAQDFFASYRERFGEDADPLAIYGYEAMKTALVAIQNAGDRGNDRRAVVRAFFDIDDRDSVLGTYSIDRFGDTTLKVYGGFRVDDGRLTFDRAIDTAEDT